MVKTLITTLEEGSKYHGKTVIVIWVLDVHLSFDCTKIIRNGFMLMHCMLKAVAPLLLLLALAPTAARAELDVGSWNTLLGEAVSDGYVDYGQWADNPRFDALVEQIAITDTSAMSRDEKLVFYINAYNIIAARGILDGSSPSGLIGRYVYFKRDKYRIAGERISLHALEHERIRPLGEPRIHFAIVCASVSCPILQDAAYTLKDLDAQLQSATIEFINDAERNRFMVEQRKAELSSIFKWFEEDFVEAAGSLQAYLAPLVASEEAAVLLEQSAFEVDYLRYDWNLNGSL